MKQKESSKSRYNFAGNFKEHPSKCICFICKRKKGVKDDRAGREKNDGYD